MIISWLFPLSFMHQMESALYSFLLLCLSLGTAERLVVTKEPTNPNKSIKREKEESTMLSPLWHSPTFIFPTTSASSIHPKHHHFKVWTICLLAADLHITRVAVVALTKSLSSYVLAQQNSTLLHSTLTDCFSASPARTGRCLHICLPH